MQLLGDPWDDIRVVAFGSEGDVEAQVVLPLLRALGWKQQVIQSKAPLQVKVGRDSKRGYADFLVRDPETQQGLIVVEAKKPHEALDDAISQAMSYANVCHAPFLVITDGQSITVLSRQLFGPPLHLLDVPVADSKSRRAELLHFLSPQAVTAYLNEQAHQAAPLELLDIDASRTSQLIREKRHLMTSFLASFDEYGQRLIEENLSKQSPWRDEFDLAEDVEAYDRCLQRLWPNGLGKRHWQIIERLLGLNSQTISTTAARQQVRLHLADQAALMASSPFEEVRTLQEGDASFGQEAEILRQVGIPLITPWTELLDGVFTTYRSEDRQRFQDWFQTIATDGDPLQERVIKSALHGRYREALTALEGIQPEDNWPVERKIARKRLLGTLCRLAGNSARALENYNDAWDSSVSLPTGRQSPWLKRRLMLDRNPLYQDDTDRFFDRHEEMLNTPAWFSNPVTDQLMHDISTSLLKEVRAQELDRPTSFRSSTHVFDAWRSYVKALYFAFATGDHYTVRDLHLHWARLLLSLKQPPLDHVLEVLWAVNEDDLLTAVVRERPLEAYQAWPDWDQALLNRPLRSDGVDAQKQHLTVLRLIPLLAPYLRDDTVQCLSQELVEGFVEHHHRSRGKSSRDEYQPVPMIEGEQFSISYAVEALTALDAAVSLQAKHIHALATALEGVPYSSWSAWAVLSQHAWGSEDQGAAREAVETLALSVSAWEQDKYVAFISTLVDAFPHNPKLTSSLITQLTKLETPTPTPSHEFSWPTTMSEITKWYQLLRRHRPTAIDFVSQEAFIFFLKQTDELRNASELRMGRSHPVRLLPLLLENYPHVLTPEQLTMISSGLVQAIGNPNLPMTHKRDLLTTLQQLWFVLTPDQQSALREQFHCGIAVPAATSARLIERVGPGHAPSVVPLHLQRLQLHATMGLPVITDDLDAFHGSLTAADDFDHAEALHTLNVLLNQGHLSSSTYHPILLSLIEDSTYEGSYALYLCLRFPPSTESPWRPALINRMRKQRQRGSLRALQAITSAAQQLPQDHEFRLLCVEALQGLTIHANRDLRNAVTELKL